MGEHRLKPPPPSRPNPYLQPSFEVALGCDLHTMVVPRQGLYIVDPSVVIDEVDGHRVAIPPDGVRVDIPDGADIVRSNEVTDEHLDVICMLRFTYTKGTVLMAGNKLPQAKIGGAELARLPFGEFKRKAEGLINGKILPDG